MTRSHSHGVIASQHHTAPEDAVASAKLGEHSFISGNAQPPARLAGRGGGFWASLRPAHDSEEARAEAAAQAATEFEGLPADRKRPANHRKRRYSPQAGSNGKLLCSSGHRSAW
jgi:hypothetical protein